MKMINPGFAEWFSINTAGSTTYKNSELSQTQTGYECSFSGLNTRLEKTIPATKEIWWSMDMRNSSQDWGADSCTLFVARASDTVLVEVVREKSGLITIYNVKNNDWNIVYTSANGLNFDSYFPRNIEVHFKTGEEGRVDIWIDTKLFLSYRSPSDFPDKDIVRVGLAAYGNMWRTVMKVSSIIIQDTRRIGLEKFKKLTIDPNTEQNMPMGSTTTYKLSGLSDATEFSDITSVCAVLQATSRDANITTGTYSINGADVGTIDVSDSSGKAYEIAHSESNSITGKPWVRDDIEGKTLSFTVNGTAG